MDVDPLGCKAAIDEVFPTNLLLAPDEVLKGVGIFQRVDGGCGPVLEAQEEKVFSVVGTVPFAAVIADWV